MQLRHGFCSMSVRVLMIGLFLVLGLQGCIKKYASCEVAGTTGIVRYMERDKYDLYLGLDRGEAPGLCATVEVAPLPNLESAQGFRMVNNAGTYLGLAPAGSKCKETTTKCASPGNLSGCGRTGLKCTHTYVQQNSGNPVNPCTCTCAP